jgi:hypothetical protein
MNIQQEIAKQLNFIISSCTLYDQGRYDEAVRIAVAARVLFHNTQASKAIIGGHYEANDLKLLSTTTFKPGCVKDSNILGFIGLLPSMGSFQAMLGDSHRKDNISWKQWWADEPIMSLFKGQESITRKQLVLASANKDGGAHVDEVKPEEYERLDDGLSIEVLVRFKGKQYDEKVKLRYANFAALRQIGYEILSSEELTGIVR